MTISKNQIENIMQFATTKEFNRIDVLTKRYNKLMDQFLPLCDNGLIDWQKHERVTKISDLVHEELYLLMSSVKEKSNETLFSINAYWKDNRTEFSALVCSQEFEQAQFNDEDIFYYGMSKSEIIKAITNGENTDLEFVITSCEIEN